MSAPLSDLYREQARTLRRFARRIEQLDALLLHRLTGPDTWVGPTPQWADGLARGHRTTLLDEVDRLRRVASALERKAADAEAAERATNAMTGAR